MSYELSIGPVSVAKHDEGNLRKGCSRGILDCGYMQQPRGSHCGWRRDHSGDTRGCIWGENEPTFESSHVLCPSCCYSKSSADSGQPMRREADGFL